MAVTAANILLAVALCVMAGTAVSASDLYCRIGHAKCSGWSYTGQMGSEVACCPGLDGQGFIMNLNYEAPKNCVCKKGTAEEYSNGATALTGFGVLATLLMLLALLLP